MNNTGVFYSVTDDAVVNGFEYYYCVAAYDWNYVTTDTNAQGEPIAWDTLILRSGIVSNYSVVPRWDAVNWVDPVVEVVTLAGDTVNNGLELTPDVVIPFEVMAEDYEVMFYGPGYIAQDEALVSYRVTKSADGSVVVDSSVFSYTVGDAVGFSLPVFNGLELGIGLEYEAPEQSFDTVYVREGSYSGDIRPATSLSSIAERVLWAFRGSDYRIEWAVAGTGQLTAQVYDETNGGIEVPYTPFASNSPPELGDGWCFVNNAARSPSDTLTETAGLVYICGGYLTLNYDAENEDILPIGASLLAEIQDGDVWQAVGYKLDGTAPYYNRYRLVATPGYESAEEPDSGLAVKVVPNPYVVFNSWESNSEERMVKFTHLPTECTIRIFSLSGDLVKVLEHVHDGDPEEGGQPHQYGGTEGWDFLNDNQQLIAAGVYVYHVESEVGQCTGKLVFIH